VATVGITDTAADHADERDDADACSDLPESITARIAGQDGA
jgi:monofunctional biosynthetic peptidoglycan transglycosylase